jgi:hypothetical protein
MTILQCAKLHDIIRRTVELHICNIISNSYEGRGIQVLISVGVYRWEIIVNQGFGSVETLAYPGKWRTEWKASTVATLIKVATHLN